MSECYNEILDIDKQIFQLTMKKKSLLPEVMNTMLDEGFSQCRVASILGISKRDVNMLANKREPELLSRGAQPKEIRKLKERVGEQK